MYSLRKITGDNVVINIYLGKSYNYVGKIESPKEFERTLDEIFQRLNEDITYAFITDENGRNAYPIYTTQKNYILIEEGKIFSYLTENLHLYQNQNRK